MPPCAGEPATAAILAALRATRTTARERQTAMERSIREEARRLRQGEAGEAAAWDRAGRGGGASEATWEG
jgi:pre-mRNA-splicing helicase BRR2